VGRSRTKRRKPVRKRHGKTTKPRRSSVPMAARRDAPSVMAAELGDEGPPPPIQVVQDRFPLCLKAKPRINSQGSTHKA
jgi:hypothetical protein